MSLLVVLGERVLREKTQTFLGKLLGRALVTVKRSFDRFINERIDNIQEYSPKPGKKIGILWFVKEFADLARLAETIFEGAERRVDLNRAYTKLLQDRIKKNQLFFQIAFKILNGKRIRDFLKYFLHMMRK